MGKVKRWIVATIIGMFIYLAIDYFNIPLAMGIEVSNINVEILGIVCNSVILFLIFALTYSLVEKRHNDNYHNQQRIAKTMVIDDCKLCQSYLNMLDDVEIRASIFNKIDYDITLNESGIYQRLIDAPFLNKKAIENYVIQGVIEPDLYSLYNQSQKGFNEYVSGSIIMYQTGPLTEELLKEGREILSKRLLMTIERANR